MYIYICVCVCVCVFRMDNKDFNKRFKDFIPYLKSNLPTVNPKRAT